MCVCVYVCVCVCVCVYGWMDGWMHICGWVCVYMYIHKINTVSSQPSHFQKMDLQFGIFASSP